MNLYSNLNNHYLIKYSCHFISNYVEHKSLFPHTNIPEESPYSKLENYKKFNPIKVWLIMIPNPLLRGAWSPCITLHVPRKPPSSTTPQKAKKKKPHRSYESWKFLKKKKNIHRHAHNIDISLQFNRSPKTIQSNNSTASILPWCRTQLLIVFGPFFLGTV